MLTLVIYTFSLYVFVNCGVNLNDRNPEQGVDAGIVGITGRGEEIHGIVRPRKTTLTARKVLNSMSV